MENKEEIQETPEEEQEQKEPQVIETEHVTIVEARPLKVKKKKKKVEEEKSDNVEEPKFKSDRITPERDFSEVTDRIQYFTKVPFYNQITIPYRGDRLELAKQYDEEMICNNAEVDFEEYLIKYLDKAFAENAPAYPIVVVEPITPAQRHVCRRYGLTVYVKERLDSGWYDNNKNPSEDQIKEAIESLENIAYFKTTINEKYGQIEEKLQERKAQEEKENKKEEEKTMKQEEMKKEVKKSKALKITKWTSIVIGTIGGLGAAGFYVWKKMRE